MGDRVAVDSSRNYKISFLGKKCLFPQGAFLVAGLLKSKISILWCEKIGNQHRVELERIFVNGEDSYVRLGKNKTESILPLMQHYVKSLEKRVSENPHLWFNFYDFWGQDVRGKI